MVEQLAADGADHALGEGVLPRGAWCRKNLGDAHAFHPSPKFAAVDTVSIAEQVARRGVIGESFDNLLRRPGSGRGIGHVEVHDLATTMQQDHEHVERTRKVAVGTTKKSTETRSARWFWRNVRQVCEGGFERRGMSRASVRGETSRPSVRSSP